MRRTSALSVLVFLSGVSTALAGGIRPAKSPIPGQYIVVFKAPTPDARGVAAALARQHGGQLDQVYESALAGFSIRMSASAAEALSHNPNVDWVEEDGVVQSDATQASAPWGLDRIDQRSLPRDLFYNYTQTGSGVHAYILDTGIRFSHVDFGGRATSGPDYIDGGAATDCNGHGTHVAATVGGATYGVAKAVSLVAVRVLDCSGTGSISGVIAGIDWVTANHVKPAVANMSLVAGASDALDLAVRNSIAAGVSYAVAAGNGDSSYRAQDACNYSPARVPEAITVSASDGLDSKASFANYGLCVDLFAPGVNIQSAWITGDTAVTALSGTSMATAHVTGAAALFLATDPAATPQAVADAIFTASTKGVVLNAATTNNHLLYTLDLGIGAPPANLPPVAGFTTLAAGLTVTFTDTSADADGTVQSWSWSFGDGSTANVPSPTHVYAAGSTYSVTLTVTDDRGATGSRTQNVTVSDPSIQIVLTATARTARNKGYADLAWTGAAGSSVDVYRNGSIVATTANDGAYTVTLSKPRGTFTFRVCQAGTSICSNQVSLTF